MDCCLMEVFNATNVDFSLVRFYGIHLWAISQWMDKLLFSIMSLKIILLKFMPHHPGANELKRFIKLTTIWHVANYLQVYICISYFIQCANLFNSLRSGRSRCDYKHTIFNLVLLSGIIRSSYDNARRWTSRDLTDDKSTLVQVMACCRQATCHYLSQCWPRSMSPYCITKPQWVNSLRHGDAYMHDWTGPYLRADSRFVFQIMACPLDGTKPLSEPMLEYC